VSHAGRKPASIPLDADAKSSASSARSRRVGRAVLTVRLPIGKVGRPQGVDANRTNSQHPQRDAKNKGTAPTAGRP
jgi:hypothetical protein